MTACAEDARPDRHRAQALPLKGSHIIQPLKRAETEVHMINRTKHAGSNYRALKPFLEAVEKAGGHAHFTAPGYMDLSIESLGFQDHEGNPVFAMAHYGEQNGDLMADPDMTFSVNATDGTIRPHTFQNDYFGMYQQVFKTVEGKLLYSQKLLRELDDFLWQWLKNIEMQGFCPDRMEV